MSAFYRHRYTLFMYLSTPFGSKYQDVTADAGLLQANRASNLIASFSVGTEKQTH